MTNATNTNPGLVQLSGDIGGNNDATAPELSPSGVVAGQYTLPQLTIDGKGRVTNAQGGDPSSISALLQNASDTQRGVVQAGAGLDVTTNDVSGYQDVIFASSITGVEATGLDACASYLIDINIDALPSQQIVVSGNVVTIQDVVDEINLVISGAVVSITSGVVRFTSNTSGRDSFVEIINDALFGCMSGFSSIDTFVRGSADCEMFATDATAISKGVVQIGDNINVTAGVISVSASGLGIATPTTLGGVIVPSSGNLDVDVSGNISVPIAEAAALGVIQVPGGDGLAVDGSGSLTIDTSAIAEATISSKGVVQIGTNIDVSLGIISIAEATTSSKGVVQVDDTNGLSIAAGVLSIDTATETTLGLVQVPVAGGLAIDVSGNLTLGASSLPDATTSSKGVVQIGTNIDVAAGIISVADATTISKGVIQVDDTSGLSIVAGVVSADIATTVLGVVQIPGGDGLAVDGSGNLTLIASDIAEATAISKGVVQIGTNIDVAAGIVSVADATNVTKGVVSSADTNNIVITAGDIDVGPNIGTLDTANTWVKSQSSQPTVLVSGATVSPNGVDSNVFTLTTDTNFTLNTPTSMSPGTRYTFIITQDATGSRVATFASNYKFKVGGNTTLSTAANATDILTCLSNGTDLYCSISKGFA